MLTITEPERPENSSRGVKKRVVLVLGRHNPGDSPASYVVQGWSGNQKRYSKINVQGLIDFLVSKHKIAQELREKLISKVKIVFCLFVASKTLFSGDTDDEPRWSLSWELPRIYSR